MARLIILLFLTYSCTTLADCPPEPKHGFELRVASCQSVAFSIDLSKDYDWYNFEDGEKIYAGTLLTGTVTKSEYQLRGLVDEKKAWNDGSVKSVFLNGVADEICSAYGQKNIAFEEVFRCCDTLPATGICVVPFPIVKRK